MYWSAGSGSLIDGLCLTRTTSGRQTLHETVSLVLQALGPRQATVCQLAQLTAHHWNHHRGQQEHLPFELLARTFLQLQSNSRTRNLDRNLRPAVAFLS